jgi:hypothetical protein
MSSGELDPKLPLSEAKRRAAACLRAAGRCEYCWVLEAGQVAKFHLDHIVPISLGGSDELNNRVWMCPTCNLSKSDSLTFGDPETGLPADVFHPRQMSWHDHFEWSGLLIVGKTPTGRAVVHALQLNSEHRLGIRLREQRLGEFPPPDAPTPGSAGT